MFREALEPVIHFFTRDRYLAQFKCAREEFFAVSGRVFDDTPYFEERQRAFFDWYVFDRRLEISGLTPLRQYFATHAVAMDAEQKRIYSAMLESVHSLFEITGKSGAELTLKDLYNDKVYALKEPRDLVGLERHDLVDSRLIPWQGVFRLGHSLCQHPREARSLIKKLVSQQKVGADKDDFLRLLHTLLGMQLKAQQYKAVHLEKIYQQNQQQDDE